MSDSSVSALASPFRHALVIFNPIAGHRRRRRLEAMLDTLSALGCRYDLHLTDRRGDAETAAQTAAAYGYDLIIVAGGDGTLNEAANGLAAASKAANGERPVPLALVPLGTANVAAAEIGLSYHPEAFARMVARGRRKIVRLGQIDERYFVLMASAGLDAVVVRSVDLTLKRRTGRFAYGLEALRQALSYRFPELTVTIDGTPYKARMAVACRARHYGGAFELAPAADLSDDRLHVVMMQRGGLLAMVRYGWALATGRLAQLPDVEVVSGSAVSIDGLAGVPVQADGDLVGQVPLDIVVSDRTIDLLVP
ncbi:MAG: diacylglycerol kinase family lipid kinase [Alphaproteobacteria bacterium]|nr:diacylglycerol kinase family lipid kinase [Alphaproteobacteria bacterium]